MSKKEAQNTEQKPEKTMTKYDLKMQKRKEEKEKEERSRRTGNIMGIVIVAALVCLVASFPIRNYLMVHGTYVKVNGEDISKVEFDYNLNLATNNYLNQYGYYLYMMGLDPSNMASQMYSETLTWGDYFQQLAVENIMRNKGLLKEAKAEGFTYDVSEEYASFEEALKKAASEGGKSAGDYRKELYGPYATESRLKPVVEESMYVAAYYDVLSERQTPSMEEIQTYYDENKANYDSADYYMLTVEAQLPTEPTELADPVEEESQEGETEGEESESQEGEDTEEAAYEPSEAEIEAAMAEAKKEADKAEKNIKTEGELHENQKRSAINSNVQDWLFEDGRKAGDTTVIEDATNHRYYVVGFEDRYLNERLSVDVRMALTTEDNGQAILDEWKAGAATEESFAEICDKYNDPTSTQAQGGLLEGLSFSNLPAEVGSWTHDEARKAGDTAVIKPEGGENTYVLYYVGTNEAEWILSIRQTLLSQKMTEYMGEFVANGQVEDPKGNLRYLEVQAEAEESSSQESSEGTDASGSTEEAEGTDSTEPSEGEEGSGSEEPSEDEEGSGSEESSEDEEGSGGEEPSDSEEE